MNKLNKLTLLLLLTSYVVCAQDLIVTSKNDSINAKIIETKKGYTRFNFVKNGEIRRTLLPLSEIKFQQKGFYSTPEVSVTYKSKNTFERPKFRIAVHGGASFLIAKTSDKVEEPLLRDHVKKLKSGYNLGFDFNYFLNEHYGFGIKFSRFSSSNKEDLLVGVENNWNLTYIGPSFVSRLVSSNGKNAWVFGFSLGYMGFKDEEQIGSFPNNVNTTITGSTLGSALDFGFDLHLSEKLYLGFLANYTSAVFSKYKSKTGGVTKEKDLEEKDNLSRIDLSVGLRFNF